MNIKFFHNTNASATGRWGRVWHGLGAGCSRALQLFNLDSGMLPGLDVALQKRELEKKLLASGYSLKLAKIAVREAFLTR